MKKLLFLCIATTRVITLFACEDGSLKRELMLYRTLTPAEFDSCVKGGFLTHADDPLTIRGKMVAIKRSTGNYSIGFVSADSVVNGRYTVVLERPVAEGSALTKQLTLGQLYVIKPERVVVDAAAGIFVEETEKSGAAVRVAVPTTSMCPFDLYRHLTLDVVTRAYNLAARPAGVPEGCLFLTPAGRLDWKEIVLGLLVVVPRSSGDYTVGCIHDKSGVLVARKLKRGEPFDVVVEKPTADELCTKTVCIEDMSAVICFLAGRRRLKFKVTDIDRGTCSSFE